jgi:hypothetical protein
MLTGAACCASSRAGAPARNAAIAIAATLENKVFVLLITLAPRRSLPRITLIGNKQ